MGLYDWICLVALPVVLWLLIKATEKEDQRRRDEGDDL